MRRNQKNVTEDDFYYASRWIFVSKIDAKWKYPERIVAALLKLHPEDVEKTDLMPTILQKQYEDDKYGILDVRVKLKKVYR